jgi:rhodanese-related sulfurtransferase
MVKRHLVSVVCIGLLLIVSGGLFPRVLRGGSEIAAPGSQDKAAQAKESEPFPEVPRVTAEQVERRAKDGGRVVFVDTDDPVAYESEHIQGAVNIPYDPARDAHEQDQTLSALPGDRLVVFYCNCAHEEDSAPLVKRMWELGYDHDKVKALKGGLVRWEQLKFPLAGSGVEPSKSNSN